jgi:amino acid transporter
MWNYMGWDNAATVAGEVERPGRTYPLAMIITTGLVALTYVLPILSVSRSGMTPAEWATGGWASAARRLSGPALETAMVVAGMLSALGTLNALILSYSRLPPVLAADGYLPASLARVHPKTGAPWVSTVVCAVGWGLALNLGFDHLLVLDLVLYGLSLILEFVALVVLRVREPDLPRPFRVPGGLTGAAVVGVAPTLLIVLALIRNAYDPLGGFGALSLGLVLVAAGPVVYSLSRR